jgi:hypothetical protein
MPSPAAADWPLACPDGPFPGEAFHQVPYRLAEVAFHREQAFRQAGQPAALLAASREGASGPDRGFPVWAACSSRDWSP